MSVMDIQDELLHLEYPFLLPDHDPEIERYYDFRAMGRSQDALRLYQNKLKFRYPDDEFRTNLMRSYRSRHPAYKTLLAEAYRSLGARSLERIKRIILFISNEAESYNEKDVYSTIKAAENILHILPKERYEAVAGIERYHRYAEHLNFRVKSTFKAAELVRAYLTESLSVVEEERRRKRDLENRTAAQERNRLIKADWESYQHQKKYGAQYPLVNLSSIVFSNEDLVRIEIPKAISTFEDQTLAYCLKYWQNTNNPAFEKILFLYSRKYGTKNYDIYMTIRRGQMNKNRDDEILSSVLSVMVTGYYYSIRGDIYLQRTWNRLKASLTQKENRLALPAPSDPKKKNAQTSTNAPAASKKVPAKKTQTKNNAEKKETKANAIKPTPSSDAVIQKQKIKETLSTNRKTKKDKGLAPVNPQKNVKTEKAITETTPLIKKTSAKKRIIAGRKSMENPTGSVSDRLQLLSGRSYDVYQERFLAKARTAIRKVLGAGKGLFYVIPEDVEDLIYAFLRDHYSDPYMNWNSSEEKKQLEIKGFAIDSIDPIIDECYKRLN